MTEDRKTEMLRKVRALLAKAESTTSIEESEAFAAKATELVSRYEITEAMISDAPGAVRTLGRTEIEVTAPYVEQRVHLLCALGKAFDCATVYRNGPKRNGRQTRLVTLWGSPAVLLATETLYTSLLLQSAKLVGAITGQPRTGIARGENHYQDSLGTRYARESWMLGFAYRVAERVADARQGEIISTPGAALVLASGLREAAEARDKEFPRLKTVKTRVHDSGAYQKGGRAAETANISNRSVSGSSRPAIGR